MPNLSEIYIYPIKSTAGLQISRSIVERSGLAFDRRFILTSTDGEFITARAYPKLLSVTATPNFQTLSLSAPDQPDEQVDLRQLMDDYHPVQVWGDNLTGQHCSIEADQWFSNLLDKPCKLLYFGEQSQRFTALQADAPVSFADGYPLLLITRGSLDFLNQKAQLEIPMQQFRPNIVVDSEQAFAEDTWKRIRIGSVEFEIVKPCERCVMTTYDPHSQRPLQNDEPLTTLRKYRQAAEGGVFFGQNVIPVTEGIIQQGDTVTVLETQPAQQFLENEIDTDQQFRVEFKRSNKAINVDGLSPLLLQAEAAGIELPFSCRAGKCGKCKLPLLSGEVKQSSTKPLTAQELEDGIILTCSSIAKSDLIIDA